MELKMETKEILEKFAPEFGSLQAWAKIHLNSSDRVLARSVQNLLDAHAQALGKLAAVGKDAEIIQQCAERLVARGPEIKALEEKLSKLTALINLLVEVL